VVLQEKFIAFSITYIPAHFSFKPSTDCAPRHAEGTHTKR
jgi:hypothetical protein